MAIKISGGNELIDPQKLLAQGEIKAGDKVADLGCGSSGHFVFPAAHLVGDNGKVYAVDILKLVLQGIESRARQDGLVNVTTVWADLEKADSMKIASSSIDLVLLVNTLFQTKDKQTVIKEAVRLLKTGGALIIGEWKTAAAPFGPPVAVRLNPVQAREAAQTAGLVFVREFEAGPYHYGLVFRKP